MYSRVYVEITNYCNKNCSFCPGTSRKLHKMDINQFRHVLHELQGVTKYIYFHIMGEPLTHPELFQMIHMANNHGFHPMITTNGSLLGTKGDALIQSGVYKVNISVHSFEKGSEEDYLNYITECIRFADIASKAGILVVLRLWNQGTDNGRNEDIVKRLKDYFGENWKVGNRGFTIKKNLFLEYDKRFQWPDLEAEDRGENVYCYGLKDHFGILCDGTVIPCCLDREGTIALGNIFMEPIDKILSSKRVSAIVEGFRNRKVTEELCRKCGYARRF